MTVYTPTDGACVAPGCHRRPAVGHLCDHHYRHIGDALAELAGQLTARPEPSGSGWLGTRGSTLASERTPTDLRTLSTQAQAPAVLGAWAEWVREQRQLSRPMVAYWSRRATRKGTVAPAGPACPTPCGHGSCNAIMWWHVLPARRTPTADRDVLAVHLDWICGTDQAAHFWCDLRGLWSQLRGHRPVRRCPCGGPVWTERGGGFCSWCSTTWTGRELLDLDRPEAA